MRTPVASSRSARGSRTSRSGTRIRSKILTPEASFVGTIVGTYNELVELVALTRRGAVKPESRTFPLAGVNDAMAALESGGIVGRGVLLPAT